MTDIKLEVNPVGALQELCVARHSMWLPEYLYKQSEKCNLPWFTVKCVLGDWVTRGEWKTKQAAKKEAARSMYFIIKGLPKGETSTPRSAPSQTFSNAMRDVSVDGVKHQMPNKINAPDMLNGMDELYCNLQQSDKPSMKALKCVNSVDELLPSPGHVLKEIGREHGFDITYFFISNKPNLVELMLCMNLFPVLVNIGTGNTVEEARAAAARTALVYIKMLLNTERR